MSFIQKLIERKTQATGSMASKYAVEEDQDAQDSSQTTQENEISVVDIVNLDEPDAPMKDEYLSAATPPRHSSNVLNLSDPFSLGDDDRDEIANISDMPDLDADITAEDLVATDTSDEAEQDDTALTDLGDLESFDDDDDISADSESFNIWDIDMDDNADHDTAAASQTEAPVTPAPKPMAAQAKTDEQANIEPRQPLPLVKPEPAAKDIEEIAAPLPEAPVASEPAAPVAPVAPVVSVAPAAPVAAPPVAQSVPQPARAEAVETPEKRRVGRVKTRLLGFEHASKPGVDMFDRSPNSAPGADKIAQPSFPVGWLVVVKGPGRGETFALHAGMSQIGRDEDQAVQLDYGDETISRNNHAAIVYDVETHAFLMGHGGKVNVVRLNGKPLICTEEVKNTDLIRIGETTLRLVALCDAEFNWEEQS